MTVLGHCPSPRAWRCKPVRAQLESNCKITWQPPQLQHAHQALFKAGFSWKTPLAFSCSVSSRFSSAVLKTACSNEKLHFWGFASLPFVWKKCAVCSGEDLSYPVLTFSTHLLSWDGIPGSGWCFHWALTHKHPFSADKKSCPNLRSPVVRRIC